MDCKNSESRKRKYQDEFMASLKLWSHLKRKLEGHKGEAMLVMLKKNVLSKDWGHKFGRERPFPWQYVIINKGLEWKWINHLGASGRDMWYGSPHGFHRERRAGSPLTRDPRLWSPARRSRDGRNRGRDRLLSLSPLIPLIEGFN